MAQTTTSGWPTNQAAPYRPLIHGFLAAWQRVVASGVQFFQIGFSAIAGSDIIKSGGEFVAFFDKYRFDVYTDYVMEWTVEQRLGQFPFGMIMGQADIKLNNASKLFSPDYDSTIGSGIRANRPVKLCVGFQKEPLQQFVGFTDPPEISLDNRSVQLHAFDALDYVNNFKLTTSGVGTTRSGMLVNRYAHEIIEQILISAGFASDQYQLDTSLQQPIAFAPLTDRKAGEVIKELTEAEQGVFLVDENGVFKWYNRQHFATLSGVNQYNLSYPNITKLEYDNTPVINDVTVKAKPRALASRQKIHEQTTTVRLEANQINDVFINFTDDFGEMPVVNVDTPTSLETSDGSFFQVNSQEDGQGTDQTTNVSVDSTYLFGTTYRLSLRNLTGSALYLNRVVLFGYPAKVTQVISEQAVNNNSIDAFGRNPDNTGESLIIENDYIQDRSTAYTLAQTIVGEYGVPFRRFVASIFADPKLQIGDWGTITLPDHGQVKTTVLTGRKLKLGANAQLEMEVRVEERRIRTFFRVGFSAIAGADEISP